MAVNKLTHAVVQLIAALSYKPEGRGFDFSMVPLEISLTKSFRPHFGPGVDPASNRNGYQEYLLEGKGNRCLELTTLALHVPIVLKSGNLKFLVPLRPAQAVYCNQMNQHTIRVCHQVRCSLEAQ
jgi:hypothetical protein